jgi:hypothetical protein
MKVVTYEGVVENGRVQVLGGVSLPEKAKVYVVFPNVYEVELPPVAHIRSPRLADPSQAPLFTKMVVTEEAMDVRAETDKERR